MRIARARRFPYSATRIERSARRRLRSAVEHAYHFVPHYRETFDALGLKPGDFTSASDLGRLPVLERSDLQADPERFISTRLPREQLVKLRTGGSSGGPVAIYHDAGALFERAAHRGRRRGIWMREAGWHIRLRQISFGTEQSSGRTISRELSRRSLIPRGLRLVAEGCSMLDPLEENVRRIERFKPHVVAGYGSYLEALMDHVEDRGGASHLPAVLVYAGDAMSERGRRTIPERFGIPVYTAYGSVEAPDLGFDCEAHRGLHINSDVFPVRIVGRDGHDVPGGLSGDVVVSNLVSRGTVLLNYRLGDVARWIPEPCPCGRRLPLLSYVEGRTDDWLELADGRLLHPQGLRELFTVENESVRRYQVEQRSPQDYLLRLVAAPRLDQNGRRELTDRLAAKVRSVVGEEVAIEFEFVEEIPRTAMGKVRTVLSPSSRRRHAATGACEVRPARSGELDVILAVMEPANMHRLDSPEMPELNLERFVVAELDGQVVGAAGWELLEPELAKTTLLAVHPEARGHGVGAALQQARMEAMAQAGAKRVRTNADRPQTIDWYKRNFGYEEVGTLAKVDAFGDPNVDEWTTLEAPLPLAPGPSADGLS